MSVFEKGFVLNTVKVSNEISKIKTSVGYLVRCTM